MNIINATVSLFGTLSRIYHSTDYNEILHTFRDTERLSELFIHEKYISREIET